MKQICAVNCCGHDAAASTVVYFLMAGVLPWIRIGPLFTLFDRSSAKMRGLRKLMRSLLVVCRWWFMHDQVGRLKSWD